jgi:uncharacterized protein
MNNIFILPLPRKQYIVYLPIQGILFKANTSAINLFHKALSGDKSARSKFGISSEQMDEILKNEISPASTALRKINFEPTTVSLFLTSECSMKCVYCYASAGERHSRILKEYVEAAVCEVIRNTLFLRKKNFTVNYHGGGDIGVVWDLVEQSTELITRLAKENNVDAIINSGINGVLSDYQRKWIVDNTNSATVSIDGYSDIQNMLRPLKNGKPSFDIVHKTLKYFDSRNFNYAIRTTATAESVPHLEKIITFFCENYEARKIKVEPVFIQGRASRNKVGNPTAKDFIDFYLRAKKTASGFKRELSYSGARFEILSDIFCLAAGSSFGVTPEGYITSCYEVLEKSDPLSEIFFYGKIEGSKIVIFQDKLEKLANLTVYEKEKCRNCFAKFHCAGDCPVKAIQSENNETDLNYRCTINRELTKDQLLNSIITL